MLQLLDRTGLKNKYELSPKIKLLAYKAAAFICKLAYMLNHKLHPLLRTEKVITVIFLQLIAENIQTDSSWRLFSFEFYKPACKQQLKLPEEVDKTLNLKIQNRSKNMNMVSSIIFYIQVKDSLQRK